VGDPLDQARKSDRQQTQLLLLARVYRGATVQPPKTLFILQKTKVWTAQNYNRRRRKVHTITRPTTQPNKGIHNQPISTKQYIL